MRAAILLAILATTPSLAAAGGAGAPESPASDGIEFLVPELAEDPFRVGEGVRPYASRISFSPGFGTLGSRKLYTLRLAYNPHPWLGWEAAFGHNPGQSVHALLHTFSAVLRVPLPWRLQPYGSLGCGMIMVYPGDTMNSDPVTRNALTAGGGLELYVRDDVALRVEARSVALLDGAAAGALSYGEGTVALAFYRSLDR
jgi:hypothetical protein